MYTRLEEKSAAYKYKVHSAIYSWIDTITNIRPSHDITRVVQDILNKPNNNGIIHIDHTSFKDPAPGRRKSFALLVSIISPEGEDTTRFLTALDGDVLNVQKSGVICYF